MQMIPLRAARWEWQIGIVPVDTVDIVDVASAEAQPGFAEWLLNGAVPSQPSHWRYVV
jgi:hypothetical protein